MTIEEAINHAQERANKDFSECSMEHQQLADWLLELKTYHNRYGKLDMNKYITITKSNNDKERISINDIESYTECNGVYYHKGNKINYHTKIRTVNHDYYVVETVEEIEGLLSNR